jgi:hypothetical protein
MEKLSAVEEARVLFTEAKDWSILKWLTEKKRVRRMADTGTAALDKRERDIKSQWTDDLRTAYAVVSPPSEDADDPYAAAEYEFVKQQAEGIPESLKAIARRVWEADLIATDARNRAESTFDEAERKMSASIARRGAEEAIAAYDVRYKAIEEAIAATQAV